MGSDLKLPRASDDAGHKRRFGKIVRNAERESGRLKDEPGAEERFMRGIRKALSTPHRKHADEPKRRPKPKGKPK